MSLVTRCGVSHIPIMEGEKVNVFIVVDQMQEGKIKKENEKMLGGISLKGTMKINGKLEIEKSNEFVFLDNLLKKIDERVSLTELMGHVENETAVFDSQKNSFLKLSLAIVKQETRDVFVVPDLKRVWRAKFIQHWNSETSNFGDDVSLTFRDPKAISCDLEHTSYLAECHIYELLNQLFNYEKLDLFDFLWKDQVFLGMLKYYGLKMNKAGLFDEGLIFSNDINDKIKLLTSSFLKKYEDD